jgi:hypothetical protein
LENGFGVDQILTFLTFAVMVDQRSQCEYLIETQLFDHYHAGFGGEMNQG